MGNLVTFLLAIAWPVAKKVLMALGIGWVTYQGLGALASAVQNSIGAQLGSLTGDVLAVASLVGLPQSMGIVVGAIMARVALVSGSKLAKL